MNFYIFSVYDSKAVAFLPPFYLPNHALAKRVFSDCANDESHQFAKHPEDFSLFCLGIFDDSKGTFEIFQKMVNFGLASSFKVLALDVGGNDEQV